MPDTSDPVEVPVTRPEAVQIAQSTDDGALRIGHAEVVNGAVTVTHTNGDRENLSRGEAIFTNDLIETGADGDVAIVFEDETIVSIAADAQLIIDDMVYDPAEQEGTLALNITEGMFTFVSGAIAKTDPEATTITTPTGQIGIRGTQMVGFVAPEGEESTFSLMAENDGTIGEVVFTNAGGSQILNQEGATIALSSFFDPPPAPTILPPEDMVQRYGAALNALPEGFRPGDPPPPREEDAPPPEEGGNGQGGEPEPGAEEEAAADGEGEPAPEEEVPVEEEIPLEEEILEEAIAEEIAAAEDAAAEETAFAQAAEEAGAFEGDAEAAAAAEEAFNEAMADGASVDEATQAAFDAANAAGGDPTVTEISVDEPDIAAADSMQSSFGGSDDSLFGGDPTGGDFSSFSSDDTSLTSTGSDDSTSSFTDADQTQQTTTSTLPPPPPPPTDTDTDTTTPPPTEPTPVPTVAPVAISGVLFTQEGITDGGSFGFTDTDSTAGQMTYALATGPTNGTVSINTDGTYTYTPTVSYTGADSFDFTVTDEAGNSDTATMTVTVNAVSVSAGTESAVNTTTTSGTQNLPSIATFSDGTYVVVFDDSTSGDILFQRFDSTGATLGSETTVNTTSTGSQWHTVQPNAVATITDDDFVVVWQSDHGGDGDIYMQRFSKTGEVQGAETIVNTTTAGLQSFSSVTGLANGGYVVTWGGPNSTDWDVYARVYDDTGTAVTGEFVVNSVVGATATYPYPQITELSGGGFVIAWASGDGSSDDVYAKVHDDSGSALGNEFVVNTTTTSLQDVVDVAGLKDGGFVTIWSTDDSGDHDLNGQVFDATGTAVGSEFLINTTTANDQDEPSVTGLADGGFVVTWASYSQDAASTWGVYGQRFDANGTAVGSEFHINTSITSGDELYQAVRPLPDGSFVVTWQSSDGDGAADVGVRSVVINVGNTTPLSETGTTGNDFYFGSLADDTIDGGAGDDKIVGGLGNDVLTGGAGNDTLLGDSGNDTLSGGDGDDFIEAGPGTDVLTGGAGNDTFFFSESTGTSTITDFTKGEDKLKIDEDSLNGAGVTFDIISGTYDGTNANDPTANFIQDGNDDLYFDSNGSAAGGYDLVSNTGGVDLDSSDFEVG